MSTPVATVISFPIVLGLLIFVHELGHFSTAKLAGVRVLEFGFGFPPRLASVVRKGTVYSLNLLPVGGFVKMLGENGEDAHNPSSFGAKPWWTRAIVLTAGPCMNLVLALFLFFITAAWLGSPVPTTLIASTSPGSPAQRAGLKPGDRIISVDGIPTSSLNEIHDITEAHLGHPVTIEVLRSGRRIDFRLVPRTKDRTPTGQGPVGVVMGDREQTYPLGSAVVRSFQGLGAMIMAIPNLINSIGRHGTETISGPIGIARLTGESASNIPQYGVGQFLAFVALLSANLGVFNLLPIPALDGGRLVLVLFAGARRKNLNPELEGMIHLAGMAILLVLIVLISYQDIVRWASGQ